MSCKVMRGARTVLYFDLLGAICCPYTEIFTVGDTTWVRSPEGQVRYTEMHVMKCVESM